MSNNIVTINVSITQAPTPSTLQQTGAILSFGGTNTAAGTLTLVTQPSDATPVYAEAHALSALTWASSVVTGTTAAAHGYTVGVPFSAVLAGNTPAGFNGTFTITPTSTTAFTFPLASSPGTATVFGTVIPAEENELFNQITAFFTQGTNNSIYILELGEAANIVTTFQTWLTANPSVIYAFLMPDAWATAAGAAAFCGDYVSPTSKVYFFFQASISSYAAFNSLKSCFTFVPSPNAAATEYGSACPFYIALNYQPSLINKVTPMAFSFLYGVQPYPVSGNGAQLAAFKTAGVNYADTGAEGGLPSDVILKWGTTMDVRDFTYWYSVDWVQINTAIAIANTVINGSNNPLNPLYYNQQGINTIQAAIQTQANLAVSYGLAQSTVSVTSIPFKTYTQANPEDYPAGVYNGFSMSYTPNRGFIAITFDINVTDFIAA